MPEPLSSENNDRADARPARRAVKTNLKMEVSLPASAFTLELLEIGHEIFGGLTVVTDHLFQFLAVAIQDDHGWEPFDVILVRQRLVGFLNLFGLLLMMRKIHVYQHQMIFGKSEKGL